MASIVTRFGFFCFFIVVFLRFSSIKCSTPYDEIVQYKEVYSLPNLPYGYDGLEPYIDEATLRVHHLGHHKAYTIKLNEALKTWRDSVSINKDKSLIWCRIALRKISSYVKVVPFHETGSNFLSKAEKVGSQLQLGAEPPSRVPPGK